MSTAYQNIYVPILAVKQDKKSKKVRVYKHYFPSFSVRTVNMAVTRYSKRLSEKGRATLYRDPNESPVSPVLVRVSTRYGVEYRLFVDHLQAWTYVDLINNKGG